MDEQQQQRACKLCGGKAAYQFALSLPGGLQGRYFECETCRLLQSYHLDDLSVDEMSAFYANADPALDSGAAWRLSCVANRLEQLAHLGVLPRGNRHFKALDFGCGSGFLVSYLAHRMQWDTAGSEPFATPSFAAHRVYKEWDDVLRHGPYHLIIASEVFEHFLKPRENLEKIAQALAPDYAFAYVTTGRYRPGTTDETWAYLGPQSGQHAAFYARESMEEVARQLNAQVFQPGAEYEWLFMRNAAGPPRRVAAACAALNRAVRLGIARKII